MNIRTTVRTAVQSVAAIGVILSLLLLGGAPSDYHNDRVVPTATPTPTR